MQDYNISIYSTRQILELLMQDRLRAVDLFKDGIYMDETKILATLTEMVNGALPPLPIYTTHDRDRVFHGISIVHMLAGAFLGEQEVSRLNLPIGAWFRHLKVVGLNQSSGPLSIEHLPRVDDPELLPLSAIFPTLAFMTWRDRVEAAYEPEVAANIVSRGTMATMNARSNQQFILCAAPPGADLSAHGYYLTCKALHS